MSVYVDRMLMYAEVPNGSRTVKGRWSHLTADTPEELHTLAQRIGLKRTWFQPEKLYPDNEATRAAGVVGEVYRPGHYDVTESKRRKAIKAGAIDTPNGGEPWRKHYEEVRERWVTFTRTPEGHALCLRVRERTGLHPSKSGLPSLSDSKPSSSLS